MKIFQEYLAAKREVYAEAADDYRLHMRRKYGPGSEAANRAPTADDLFEHYVVQKASDNIKKSAIAACRSKLLDFVYKNAEAFNVSQERSLR